MHPMFLNGDIHDRYFVCSHPSKAMVAAQRRLFPPTKENTSPKKLVTAFHLRIKHSPLFYCLRIQRSASVGGLSLHQLAQRQKQIDYGKNTLGYQRYIQTVPKYDKPSG